MTRIPITPELLAEARALMPDADPCVIDSDSSPRHPQTNADEIICVGASDMHILQHTDHIELHAYGTGAEPDRITATGPTLIEAMRALLAEAERAVAPHLLFDLVEWIPRAAP